MRSVVVLPAPLGPRKPVMLPAATSNDNPSTATRSSKRFVRSIAEMAAMDSTAILAREPLRVVGTLPSVRCGALRNAG
jgi:hypothetical protein